MVDQCQNSHVFKPYKIYFLSNQKVQIRMNYWLVKSEPHKYAWTTFEEDGRTCWDGVRNYQARNSLKAMQAGDLVLYYHSNEGKEIVGIAKVVKEAYQDPTTEETEWVAVDLAPVQRLIKPVSLQLIKADKRLENIGLLRQMRLSVMPLKREEFDTIIALGS
jgi:predicted RNA-binding protein with PUA-like domain